MSELDAPDFDLEDAEDKPFVLDLDGYEGPLHLLLELARAQKVDLARISVAALADQYLDFIAKARAERIDLAADYLVMASWLALIKSRLLLPKPERATDEPDADQLAAHLRKRLEHLEMARAAAKRLWGMPQLGRDVFLMGQPQKVAITRAPLWQASLFDLLSAYGSHASRFARRVHAVHPRPAYPIEDARHRLESMLSEHLADWRRLEMLAPPHETGPNLPPDASYVASLLGAALELVRDGRLEARQAEPFAPVFLKSRAAP